MNVCTRNQQNKTVGQVSLAIVQWEEKWKAMMSELSGVAKIPDLCGGNVGSVGNLSQGREWANDARTTRTLGRRWCHTRPTRPSKHEEDRKRCMSRRRWTTLGAASQKIYIWKMWTRSDEDGRVTMMGHFARDCRRNCKGKREGCRRKHARGKGKTMNGAGKESNGQVCRLHGRTFGTSERLEDTKDMRQGRTQVV